MPNFITDNPAAFTAALRAFLIALLGLGAVFGLHVTAEQKDAILNFAGAAIAISLIVSAVTVKTTVPKTPSVDAPPAAIQDLPPVPPAQ